MAYQAFRENGAPTYYGPNQTPWMADILEAGLIVAFCILAVSFYIILPGIRGKEKFFTFIRVTLSLFIGGVIILSNFSYTWETAEIHTRTKYKAGTGEDITADIGVHIGLRGINITLKGSPDEQQLNETINYNEHFSWEWAQGRIGFGPFAGRFNQEYRAAQLRGLPLPILWIAEYFTFDGEGIRWGRHYRQAGWFSHILLWLCFPLWLLTNILFFVLLRYGAYFMMMTGTSMVVANIIWATIRNVNELKIPFEDGIMEFSYGGSFYICLVTGILCFILGLIIFILDLRFPTELTTFFGVDVLQDADDVAQDVQQIEKEKDFDNNTLPKPHIGIEEHEMDDIREDDDGGPDTNGRNPMQLPVDARIPAPKPPSERAAMFPPTADDDDDEIYEAPTMPAAANRYEKRKSRGLTMRQFQKSRRRRPPPPPPTEEDDMYVNTASGYSVDDVQINMT